MFLMHEHFLQDNWRSGILVISRIAIVHVFNRVCLFIYLSIFTVAISWFWGRVRLTAPEELLARIAGVGQGGDHRPHIPGVPRDRPSDPDHVHIRHDHVGYDCRRERSHVEGTWGLGPRGRVRSRESSLPSPQHVGARVIQSRLNCHARLPSVLPPQ